MNLNYSYFILGFFRFVLVHRDVFGWRLDVFSPANEGAQGMLQCKSNGGSFENRHCFGHWRQHGCPIRHTRKPGGISTWFLPTSKPWRRSRGWTVVELACLLSDRQVSNTGHYSACLATYIACNGGISRWTCTPSPSTKRHKHLFWAGQGRCVLADAGGGSGCVHHWAWKLEHVVTNMPAVKVPKMGNQICNQTWWCTRLHRRAFKSGTLGRKTRLSISPNTGMM